MPARLHTPDAVAGEFDDGVSTGLVRITHRDQHLAMLQVDLGGRAEGSVFLLRERFEHTLIADSAHRKNVEPTVAIEFKDLDLRIVSCRKDLLWTKRAIGLCRHQDEHGRNHRPPVAGRQVPVAHSADKVRTTVASHVNDGGAAGAVEQAQDVGCDGPGDAPASRASPGPGPGAGAGAGTGATLARATLTGGSVLRHRPRRQADQAEHEHHAANEMSHSPSREIRRLEDRRAARGTKSAHLPILGG